MKKYKINYHFVDKKIYAGKTTIKLLTPSFRLRKHLQVFFHSYHLSITKSDGLSTDF